MRLHIKLDDLPEFDTFHSAWLAIRGVHWSLTNTPLPESCDDDAIQKLLDAIHNVENTLRPLVQWEEGKLVAHRERRLRFANGDIN